MYKGTRLSLRPLGWLFTGLKLTALTQLSTPDAPLQSDARCGVYPNGSRQPVILLSLPAAPMGSVVRVEAGSSRNTDLGGPTTARACPFPVCGLRPAR